MKPHCIQKIKYLYAHIYTVTVDILLFCTHETKISMNFGVFCDLQCVYDQLSLFFKAIGNIYIIINYLHYYKCKLYHGVLY